MENEVCYYRSTSGRTVFVKFDEEGWSNQKLRVKKSSISDLRPFSELIGAKIHVGEYEGIITNCNPIDLPLKGKHIGLGVYLSHKEYLNINNLVLVHWTKGHIHSWQPFYKMTVATTQELADKPHYETFVYTKKVKYFRGNTIKIVIPVNITDN